MVVSGRKKVDLFVTVNMQYTLPLEEYQAKVQASKARELTESLIKLNDVLQRDRRRVQNQHQAAGMIWRAYHEQRRRIENEMRANNISQEMMLELEAAIRESFDQAVFKSRPASKASVKALEKFVLDDGDGGSCSMCVICQEEMLTGFRVIRLPCFHMFHGDCIVEWLNRWGHTCPVCKFKLPREEI